MRHSVMILAVLWAMAVAASSVMAVAVNPEDFESYPPDTGNNWPGSASWNSTDGWVPVYNAYGWASSGTAYIWPDGGYEIASPQVLRRNDNATSGNALFWDQSADITLFPMQTVELKHRGLQQDSSGYGRVIVGTGGNKVEYDNWTGGTGSLNGTPLPANNVSWQFGTGYSQDWFVTQIEYDHANDLIRARFGQVQGDLWNDWTAWQAMASTAQPSFVEIQLNGRIEIDDAVFTAVPEPATLCLFGIAGLALRLKRRNG